MVGRISFLLAIVLCCSISMAEEAVEIPLSEVWAYDMPGTKDVRELEPEIYGEESKSLEESEHVARFKKSIIQEIRRSLAIQPYTDANGKEVRPRPGKAFVVEGLDKSALLEVNAVLSRKKKPKRVFPAGSELTLVFYSLQAGCYVHLTSVVIEEDNIIISFQFVPHFNSVVTSHFALIPIPNSEPGKIQVQIVQEPMINLADVSKEPEIMTEWQDELVCKPFSFTIEEEK